MRFHTLCIGLLALCAFRSQCLGVQPNVDEEITALLDQAEKASPMEKRRLLQRIVKLLPNRNRLDDKGITRRFAKLLTSASPKEVRMLLGTPTLIVRQIVYRRYREQWYVDAPVRLLIVVDARQGEPPTIQTVQPRPRTKR